MKDLQKQLLDDYNIETHSYPNCLVENIPDFLKKIDSITSTEPKSIIQLLDCDYICGEKHLNQAIAQSIKAFNEKQNFANDKGLEICVRLSAQKQITQALKLLGIKNKCNITIVYINASGKQIKMVEELLPKCCDEIIEEYDANQIIKAYNISSSNIVDTINEQIALLSIKN